MKKATLCLLLVCSIFSLKAQTLLQADGKSDTYELINNSFAPGYDVLEVPDCSHSDFGKHIDQVFDETLNEFVFRFHVHSNEDNDGCKNIDQQRNEIKGRRQSPTSVLGTQKETVTYSWKFKIGEDFIPSKKFSYLHQLKAIGSDNEDIPLFALSARNGNSEKLSLTYAKGNRSSVLFSEDLAPFKGQWISAVETVTYGEIGAYKIELKHIDTDEVLFSYTNEALNTWKPNAEFISPKWGIFRSIETDDEIKDEIVSFADFNIEKSDALSQFGQTIDRGDISIYPNPTSSKANIKGDLEGYDKIILCDSFGKEIPLKTSLLSKTVDVSRLKNGIYFVVFKKDNKISSVKKLLKF